MRSMWNGSLNVGLLSLPIKLYTANEARDVTFHQVHAKDGGRIKYRRVCSLDGADVEFADVARGLEVGDKLSIITDDDLAKLPLQSAKEMLIQEFITPDKINPVDYCGRNYYCEPQAAAEHAYEVLRGAMAQSGRLAVVMITLRQREHLGVLRALKDPKVLMLQLLWWPDEVREASFGFLRSPAKASVKERDMARQLITNLEGPFDRTQYKDGYREALAVLAEGKVIAMPVSRQEASGDLLAKLTASVTQQQRSRAKRRKSA